MQARDAKAIARQWVHDAVGNGAAIDGAFLHGSITWPADDDELPPASDIDIVLVPAGSAANTDRGKITVSEVTLDLSHINRRDLSNAESILGAYHLASSFRLPDNVLFDRDGWLTSIQE